VGMKSLAVPLLMAMAGSAMASGTDDFTTIGMQKLQRELGPNCPVRLKNVGETIMGNNGLRQEQWFVETCHGVEQFWVSYYPPNAFPNRVTHLEVQRVTDKVNWHPLSNQSGPFKNRQQ
jgi:hypothetical protein